MTDSWLSVRCIVREADAQRTEAILENSGSLAITVEGGQSDTLIVDTLDGENRLWPVCEITGLFDLGANVTDVEHRLCAAEINFSNFQVSTLQEKPWHESWRAQFNAQQYGGRLWVGPTWEEPPADQHRVVRIDPGMAFGTGNHETTALCLQWLANTRSVSGSNVLDYGCGSGILAMAAARLDASSVTAVDIDPQAIDVATANAALNNISNVEFGLPTSVGDQRFDIIIANILLEPLSELAQTFCELLRPGGQIVLSGILSNQVEQLLASYTSAFTIDTVRESGEWALVAGREVLRRKGNSGGRCADSMPKM